MQGRFKRSGTERLGEQGQGEWIGRQRRGGVARSEACCGENNKLARAKPQPPLGTSETESVLCCHWWVHVSIETIKPSPVSFGPVNMVACFAIWVCLHHHKHVIFFQLNT